MSRKSRTICGIVAASLWIVWIVANLTAEVPVMWFPLEVVRAAATIAASAWAVSWAVRPVMETVSVWRQIGKWEQRQQPCDRCGQHGEAQG